VRAGPPEGGAAAYCYNTSAPGAYTISATVAGAHARGSPATVVASIAEPHAPLCAVKGAPREISAVAGGPLACLRFCAQSMQLAHVCRTATEVGK